jgi:site-specific DNA recombinase
MSAEHSTNGLLIPAAAYYRMSDPRQDDSVDRQKSQVEPYAPAKGYEIVRVYVDEGISGSEIARRKEFQRMLRDAQAGHFRAILCDDKDRFGRFDSIDLGEIVAPLRRKGVWVDTVAQGKIDWTTFAGRVTDAVLQEAKNLEQEAIARRVLSMQLLAADKAVFTGGPPPYGYRLEPDPLRGKRYVPDGHKAEIVRYIFRRYDEGATLRQIARELEGRGMSSPTGRSSWAANVLHNMLSNRKYVGDWTWGTRAMGKRFRHAGKGTMAARRPEEQHYVRLPPSEWVVKEDTHEALVDRDLFARVQARLAENRREWEEGRRTPLPGGGAFVLTRLLVCGHCGGYLLGATRKGERIYSCGNYIRYGKARCNLHTTREAPLVQLLLRKLQQLFLDPDNLGRLRREIAEQESALKGADNLGRLRQNITRLEDKFRRGQDRLLEVSRKAVADAEAALERLRGDLAEAKAELRRAEAATPTADLEKRITAAETLLWGLADALRADDWPLVREVLREAIVRVELFWTHRKHAKITRSKLERGVIYLRPQEVLSLSRATGR